LSTLQYIPLGTMKVVCSILCCRQGCITACTPIQPAHAA
jgi:hypothetical protein